MWKKLIITLFLIGSFDVWSQSNELLDSYLEQKSGDVATSLLFVGQASGLLPLDATPDQAYTWGTKQRFKRSILKLEPNDSIPLGVFYQVLFESFKIKGGIWFTIFRSPRQAALEANYKGLIDSSTLYYNRDMSPYEILTNITIIQEGDK